jgi:DNA-binding NarL/FixJ family response regulator
VDAEAAPFRLVIVDDHELVRTGLKRLLAPEPYLEVIGEASDGREAVALCRRLEPDLVLMDVRLPAMDGLEATRRIKAQNPRTRVMIITVHESRSYLMEAVRAGAAGYVLKDAPRPRLVNAIRRVLEGDSPLDQDLAIQLIRHGAGETGPEDLPLEDPPEAAPISGRETEVLRLLCLGRTNREIAEELVLSTGTVKVHIHNVISKLGVSDRTQAAVRAVELGLLPDDP